MFSKSSITLIVVVVLAVILAFMSFGTVPTGYTGILVTFGRVSNNTLEAGFHLKNPLSSIVKMDNREQKRSVETACFSSDIQQVDLQLSVNYNITKSTAMKLYQEIGTSFYDILIVPRLHENTKAVFSQYSAEKLIAERSVLSTQIKELLSQEMLDYGINIINVSIEDIDFTNAFTSAVEDKQVAEQTKLRVETEQAQAISVAKAEAERKVIQANAEAEEKKIAADAEAYSIKARAEAEAESNTKVSRSLTAELIEYVKATNWNGVNPQTVLGENTVSVITP